MSSERPISKLSENHKIYVIVPTKVKLWPFKRCFIFVQVEKEEQAKAEAEKMAVEQWPVSTTVQDSDVS